jgi:hypothetical protein
LHLVTETVYPFTHWPSHSTKLLVQLFNRVTYRDGASHSTSIQAWSACCDLVFGSRGLSTNGSKLHMAMLMSQK